MQPWIRSACSLASTIVVIGCGSPATPPTPPAPAPPAPTAATPPTPSAPAPSAPTAATPPAPAVMDPKGTIDTAKRAAAAANAATDAREASAAGQAAPATQPSPSALTGAAASAAPALAPNAPKYEAGGRRDPFESLELKVGSDRSTVAAAKLTGVVRSGGKAYALVETSDGIGYILKTGDILAEGRLVEITGNTAVFAVAAKPGSTTNRIVLRLPSD